MLTNVSTKTVDRGHLRIMESASPDMYSLTVEDGRVTGAPRSIYTMHKLILCHLQILLRNGKYISEVLLLNINEYLNHEYSGRKLRKCIKHIFQAPNFPKRWLLRQISLCSPGITDIKRHQSTNICHARGSMRYERNVYECTHTLA